MADIQRRCSPPACCWPPQSSSLCISCSGLSLWWNLLCPHSHCTSTGSAVPSRDRSVDGTLGYLSHGTSCNAPPILIYRQSYTHTQTHKVSTEVNWNDIWHHRRECTLNFQLTSIHEVLGWGCKGRSLPILPWCKRTLTSKVAWQPMHTKMHLLEKIRKVRFNVSDNSWLQKGTFSMTITIL